MSIPTQYNFQRFLAAKKSVDDRALNSHVLNRLTEKITDGHDERPLQVLEVGAGTGTMLARLASWCVLKNVCYDAIDLDPENIREAERLIPAWSNALGFDLTNDLAGFKLIRKSAVQDISVHFEAGDMYEFIARNHGSRFYDLIIAHAFMDLVDADRALPGLMSLMKQNGLLYLTSNFDGVTTLEPPVNLVRDDHVITLYHESMDARLVNGLPSGDSRTGRHLFSLLHKHRVELLDAGSSDWVVYPVKGGYPCDEAYFLHYIINLIETTLKNHPALSPMPFDRWIAERHNQVERGELVFIVHQMDFLGRIY